MWVVWVESHVDPAVSKLHTGGESLGFRHVETFFILTKGLGYKCSGWWFQTFFMFTPIGGRFSI